MKALRYILYALVILAAVGVLFYSIFWKAEFTSTDIIKCGLIIVGAILGILKTGKRSRPVNKKATYQKAYGEFIQDAFSDDPKLEKKFYSAIDDYNCNKPSSGLAKLEKLRSRCHRTADLFAVTMFMGLCCDDMGVYPDAIRHYQAAASMRINSTVYSNLGLCYQKSGKFEQAQEAYDRAIAIDSKNTYAMTNLAVLHFRRGDYETSLSLSRQVLELDAGMVQALSNAALCCAVTGRKEEYEEFYRRAVSNGYDGRKIKNYLAQMAMEENEEAFQEGE